MLFSADRTISHANMLECCVCLSVSSVTCVLSVAKWCVLDRKSYVRNRLVPKWMTLAFV